MAGSKGNIPDVFRSTKPQGGGFKSGYGKLGAPVGQNRRALSEINKNIITAPTAYPYANSNGKKPIPAKKPLVPVRRPVTRAISTQITSKPSLPLPEGKKPKIQTIPDEIGHEDCSIIDVEEDFNAPMFVQHTESMLEEIDKMDEDVYEEPIVDIDDADKGDPLAVVEYVDEIYAHYRKQEISSCVSPNYMSQHQHDITDRMRGILIDWLIEVHYKFELMEETLYLTVNLVDRFLACRPVGRKNLQLVGITSMLLACKYEEISVPIVDDFIVISDKAYTRNEVLDMEKEMMNTLEFNLSVPTPFVFMKRFLKAASSYKEMELLAFYLVDLCLVDYEMLKFPPSLLAAAAVFTAESTLNRSMQWTKTSQHHSNYSQNHLLECSKLMVGLHQKAGSGRLVAVFKKYSTSKYGHVARTQPANFILEPRFWD